MRNHEFSILSAEGSTIMSRRCYVFAFLAATFASPALATAEAIEIKPGDHIAIIGNTLADRMQHDGWLETYPPGSLSRRTSSSSATSASPAMN